MEDRLRNISIAILIMAAGILLAISLHEQKIGSHGIQSSERNITEQAVNDGCLKDKIGDWAQNHCILHEYGIHSLTDSIQLFYIQKLRQLKNIWKSILKIPVILTPLKLFGLQIYEQRVFLLCLGMPLARFLRDLFIQLKKDGKKRGVVVKYSRMNTGNGIGICSFR